MGKKRITALLAGAMLLSSIPVCAGEATDYNDKLAVLYAYADLLEQPFSEVYDLGVVRNEQKMSLTQRFAPNGPIAWTADDFDGDGEPELLVVEVSPDFYGKKETINSAEVTYGVSRMDLCMYELYGKSVAMKDHIETKLSPYPADAGTSQVYLWERFQDERLIGVECRSESFILADGLTLGTVLYRYDGERFVQVDELIKQASDWSDNTFFYQFGGLGIMNVDPEQILSGEQLPSDYADGAAVLFTAEAKAAEDASAKVMDLREHGQTGDVVTVGTLTLQTKNAVTARYTGTLINPADRAGTPEDTAAIRDASDYILVGFDDGPVTRSVYYMLPDLQRYVYDVTDFEGNIVATVGYGTAKDIVDLGMTGQSDLPITGSSTSLIWNSPYGLCAYTGNRDQYSGDLAQIKYTLNEQTVADLINQLALPMTMIPVSQREN